MFFYVWASPPQAGGDVGARQCDEIPVRDDVARRISGAGNPSLGER